VKNFPNEDGSFISGSGGEAWELWPSGLPRPEMGGKVTVTGTSGDDGSAWLLPGGVADGALAPDGLVDDAEHGLLRPKSAISDTARLRRSTLL
jgi:hypothetical protein